MSLARTFLRWAVRNGHTERNVMDDALADGPLGRLKRVYGKLQSKNPGRWLTRDEVYGQLIPACQDGTDGGLRDEVALRLGLLGMRDSEVRNLTHGDLHRAGLITFTGKGAKPATLRAPDGLTACLERWFACYSAALGRPMLPSDPVLCPLVTNSGRIRWGSPVSRNVFARLVAVRSQVAGLGHLAPHDLRRTCAGLLHNAKTAEGAHHFDLLDIQKQLRHSDPATTMRCYLDPMDTEVIDRAAAFLDG